MIRRAHGNGQLHGHLEEPVQHHSGQGQSGDRRHISAVASQAPSINFYVALDTSPSMLLPTTTSGITNLNAGARWNGEYYYYKQVDGCDFACHSNNMQQWNMGTYVIDSSKNAIYLNNDLKSSITFFRVPAAAMCMTTTTT
jgi:hypothetical protein